MNAGIPVHLAALRHTNASGLTRPEAWRRTQLERLGRMLRERSTEFERALQNDLGKPPLEAQITELSFVLAEIAEARARLRRWMRPRRVAVPPALVPAAASVVPEPLGTVLIISPWNYPLMLALSPLVGAIAAGNTAVLKPSELAPATSRALARWIPEYLDVRAFRVIEGGVAETTELLGHRFDHIFFTGSSRVGRVIARAAAEHLTPVTLELGGKSPLYLDGTVDVRAAAKRIAWAKFMNCGQTCVAPDYVLGTRDALDALGPALRSAIHDLYGNAIARNPDYGRIVSDAQFDRLVAYLGDGDLIAGGAYRASDRFIEPTVLDRVPRDAAVMREEIFGPILPLVEVDDLSDAIRFVREHDAPLSAYVFSEDSLVRERWRDETTSGALTFNAPVLHLSVPELPFGGVGESGMGAYHGKRTFDRFSHEKAVLAKPLVPDTLGPTIMPPFTRNKETLVRKILTSLMR